MRLPFSYYSNVSASNLQNLNNETVMFLDSSGCLHLPQKEVLDMFVNHYFLYMHHTIPIVDEADFGAAYWNRVSSRPDVSLLLLKALMCATCNFLPIDAIRQCGYDSYGQAREALYREAKLLYDFQIERDPFIVCQAALLLSFHATKQDQLSNSTWLAVATQRAISLNAHRYSSSKSKLSEKEREALKRLWWCCILRDRVISMGARRPMQISTLQFDFSQDRITMDDLEPEVAISKVFDTDSKIILCNLVTVQCDLATSLSGLSSLFYSGSGRSSELSNQEDNSTNVLEVLETAKAPLDNWARASLPRLESLAKSDRQPISLYATSLLLHYHNVRIAICNYHGYLLSSHLRLPEKVHRTHLQNRHSELTDAVDAITECFKHLVQNNSAEYLSLSTLSTVDIPFMLMSLNKRLRNSSSLGKGNALRCFATILRIRDVRFDMGHIKLYMMKAMREFKLRDSISNLTSGDDDIRPSDLCSLVSAHDQFLSTGKQDQALSPVTSTQKQKTSNSQAAVGPISRENISDNSQQPQQPQAILQDPLRETERYNTSADYDIDQLLNFPEVDDWWYMLQDLGQLDFSSENFPSMLPSDEVYLFSEQDY
ncbi:uncharacterized protein PV06_03705 [Exophiala oligosperma]|uniref:Xylanolytic transcriptional activator regulatory domain-containing protein n=1 Tax=Exophiala oligosperma TaxID=215243 RepID=A0A0D2C659_9EURO|nr:uncharacterized protein PV06_03705 [Exophiala oligosperma]KIW45307.1 hypothetical protein PV06_03705 [Exophiala oligosperma]